LQRIASALTTHLAMREPPQLLINHWNNAIERRLIAVAPIDEEAGDFLRRGLANLSC